MNKATDVFETLKDEIAKLDKAREYPVMGAFDHLFELAQTSEMKMSGLCDPEDAHYLFDLVDGNMRTAFGYLLNPAENIGDLCSHSVYLVLEDGDEEIATVEQDFMGVMIGARPSVG